MPHLGIGSQAGRLPDAPTGISASQAAGATAVDVAFTAPTHKGKGGTIANYVATASPGGATSSGTASPITFNNLSAGTEYNFNVEAVTAIGNTNFTGSSGASSKGYTPVVPNIAVPTEYNTTTTYTPNVYPFTFKVAAIGGGGGVGNNNTYYARNSNTGPWGSINNSLAGGDINAGGGGGGRIHYVNTAQTINSGSIVMTVGTGGGTGASGGATNVYLNQNAANVATANGGSSGGAIIQGTSNALPNNTQFNANATTGSGGAGGSGGGTGSVGVLFYNEYGTNKGVSATYFTNGGTAGNAGGSGGATSNGAALGNGAWKSGTGGSGSGNTGQNANSQIPSGGGNSPATSQINISGTNYLTNKGRGHGSVASTDGAVLLIPA